MAQQNLVPSEPHYPNNFNRTEENFTDLYNTISGISWIKTWTQVQSWTWEVTFTPWTTVFDVAATKWNIDDDTWSYIIDYAWATWVSVTNTTASSTYVYIDNTWTLQQQITEPTREEYRTKLFLTRLALAWSVLTAQEEIANPWWQYTNSLRDYLSYVSSPHKWLELTWNTNLTFNVSAGSIFELGISNSTEPNSTNEREFTTTSPTTFFYLDRDTIISTAETNLNVTQYDNNWTLTTLTNNRFKIMTAYKFNSWNVIIQEWQGQYTSLDNAQAAISTRTFVRNPVNDNWTRIGWIIVQKNATDLTNTATARFINDTWSTATSTTTVWALLASNNLSDLENTTTARSNLDVYSTTETDNLLDDKVWTDWTVLQAIALTQAEYDALTPVATTFYIITDA